jgi:uncharacterized membrane protein (UPF0127 family)
VLASADVASTRADRRRGLLGRDTVDSALVLRPCRQVHTFGMRVPIDVLWCDADGRVLRVATVRPARITRLVLRSRFVVEADAGAATRWGLCAGDVVEVEGESDGGGA